jgi:HAMP domain-containing protein/CHASE3 domain sensor protein
MDLQFWNYFRKYENRLSLKGRIGLGITISRLIFLPVIFLAVYYIAGMVNTTNQIARVDAKSALLAEQISAEINEMRSTEKNYLLLKDPGELKKIKERAQVILAHIDDGEDTGSGENAHFAQLKDLVKSYFSTIEKISQTNESVQDATALSQFSKLVRNHQNRIDAFFAVANQARSREEISRTVDEISKEAMSFDNFILQSVMVPQPSTTRQELQSKGEEIEALVRQIRANSWGRVSEERNYAEHLGSRATLLITITLAVTLLLSFAFTWYLPRKVLRPIREVAQALRKASSGNYDVFLQLKPKDELGELVGEFHNLVEHIKGLDNNHKDQSPLVQPIRQPVRNESFTFF